LQYIHDYLAHNLNFAGISAHIEFGLCHNSTAYAPLYL